MNSTRPLIRNLAFHVFGRPLHPELFATAASRKVQWRDAVVEVGVLGTGHWIRFTRGGLTVSEAQRLKALESENSKLKRLLAESLLDNAALKDIVVRKW